MSSRRKGRNKYCPGLVIEELDMIKMEEGVHSDSEAFKKMVDFAKIGKEIRENTGLKVKKSRITRLY